MALSSAHQPHYTVGRHEWRNAPLTVTAGVFILGREEQLITGDVFSVLMGKYENCFQKRSADSHRVTSHLIWICMSVKKDNIISILSYLFFIYIYIYKGRVKISAALFSIADLCINGQRSMGALWRSGGEIRIIISPSLWVYEWRCR